MTQQIRICDHCIYFEPFGEQGKDEFFNKCALLDIFNIEECETCDSFQKLVYVPKPRALMMIDPQTKYEM